MGVISQSGTVTTVNGGSITIDTEFTPKYIMLYGSDNSVHYRHLWIDGTDVGVGWFFEPQGDSSTYFGNLATEYATLTISNSGFTISFSSSSMWKNYISTINYTVLGEV